LNDRVRELKDELAAQSVKMREEAESHIRVRAQLNDRISGLSSDHESLQVIHNELIAHVEKLEHLNVRCEPSISESGVQETRG
jgi:uncharacterized coiled-coil DUF342 family protein